MHPIETSQVAAFSRAHQFELVTDLHEQNEAMLTNAFGPLATHEGSSVPESDLESFHHNHIPQAPLSAHSLLALSQTPIYPHPYPTDDVHRGIDHSAGETKNFLAHRYSKTMSICRCSRRLPAYSIHIK